MTYINKINIVGLSRLRMGIDGKGIRTLVVVENCPLRCKYCINPYSWNGSRKSQQFSVKQLYEKLKIDNLYFKATCGGVTFGGGEPLLYADFIRDFSDYIKGMWNIGIETSLNVPINNLKKIINKVDFFVIDIKSMNEVIYQQYTSHDNKQVKANLTYLMTCFPHDSILVRVPYIPYYTSNNDIENTVNILKNMGIKNIDIFNYKLISNKD